MRRIHSLQISGESTQIGIRTGKTRLVSGTIRSHVMISGYGFNAKVRVLLFYYS